MRLLLIALGSAVMTFAAIANAFIQKSQFYPAVVYITKSNPSMAVRKLINDRFLSYTDGVIP